MIRANIKEHQILSIIFKEGNIHFVSLLNTVLSLSARTAPEAEVTFKIKTLVVHVFV